MIDYGKLVDRYLAMWNEGDAARRRQAIAAQSQHGHGGGIADQPARRRSTPPLPPA
jgi:hypothetical protein